MGCYSVTKQHVILWQLHTYLFQLRAPCVPFDVDEPTGLTQGGLVWGYLCECVDLCMPHPHSDFENGLVHFLCPLTAKFDSWKNS